MALFRPRCIKDKHWATQTDNALCRISSSLWFHFIYLPLLLVRGDMMVLPVILTQPWIICVKLKITKAKKNTNCVHTSRDVLHLRHVTQQPLLPILIPFHAIKSLQPLLRSVTHRFHLRVLDLKIRCTSLIYIWRTGKVVPVMPVRVTYSNVHTLSRQSHAQNVPISALKKALPPPRSSPDHHNCLIRSPPPTLKRTGEVSPVPG